MMKIRLLAPVKIAKDGFNAVSHQTGDVVVCRKGMAEGLIKAGLAEAVEQEKKVVTRIPETKGRTTPNRKKRA